MGLRKTNKNKLKIRVDVESDLPTESDGRVSAHTQLDFTTLAGHNDVTSRQWIITSCMRHQASVQHQQTHQHLCQDKTTISVHSALVLCGALWSWILLCASHTVF